jgi:4-amino-4-deoxy-L-arabinose transferase-like glycosyltransferase
VACGTLYRIAVLLFDDARIGAVAAIAYAVTPAVAITFAVATPDGPSTLFWLLAIWAVAEFTAGRNANWWLAAGVFAGMGLLSKYTVAFLGAGLLLYLFTGRERRQWLRLWQVWAGGALALAMFAPVVWIDAQRGWMSFSYQLGRSSLDSRVFEGFYEFIRFLIEEAIQLLPTLFVFLIMGIAMFFARRASGLALPVLTAVPMVAYFLTHALFGRVNPNWTAPIFPQLALVGAWASITIRPQTRWLRWPLDALRILHVPLGVAVLLTAFAAVEYRALPGLGPLPAFDYVYGWRDLQAKVSRTAADQGAQWVDVEDYSLAGWLGYYGKVAADPLPVLQTSEPFRYQYKTGIGGEPTRAPHLLVRYARGGDIPQIPGAVPIGTITRQDDAGKVLASYWVWLVDG